MPLVMNLHSIRLQDIRGFKDITVEFDGSDGTTRKWALLVGANGTGKTTLLRAVAIGLAGESDANAMLASPVGKMVTAGQSVGTIELTVSEPNGARTVLQTTIKASGSRESIRRGPTIGGPAPNWPDIEPFVAGYGISRLRTGKELQRGRRVFDSTRSLFDYDALLTPLELTLRRVSDYVGTTAYSAIMKGINTVLNLPDDTEIQFSTGGGVLISGSAVGQPIPFEGWADGFRLNLAWIVDFFGVALAGDALADDGSIQGLLLIDEIEQHTHPGIQETLVAQLKALWPELQVIATTHSPLVVLGAVAEEVVVLKRTPQSGIVQAPRPASFRGFTAEDILTDKRIFNTDARSGEETALIEEYKTIASKPVEQRSATEQERLSSLGRNIRDMSVSAQLRATGNATEDITTSVPESFPQPGPLDTQAETELVDDLKKLRMKYNL